MQSDSSTVLVVGNQDRGLSQKLAAWARNGHDQAPRRSVAPSELGQRYIAEYAPRLAFSPAMRLIRDLIEQVADANVTVLLRGESGVGKEVVARAIHSASPRADEPLVKVNCAALPSDLLESELFGHEKGAFTGAYRRKLGKFEFANKGTLFLDEIGELPLGLQAKLLHALQDREFSRLGGREVIRVDVRVIASTNRDLEAALAAGQFREDLYYRLNVVEVCIPPLRERREEIPSLVSYFLERFQQEYGRTVSISTETTQLFMQYGWPGNVRELENAVRRLVVLGDASRLHGDLLTRLRAQRASASEPASSGATPSSGAADVSTLSLREIARRAAREAERRAIEEVLNTVHWNRTEAARRLKISYKSLLSKMTGFGLASKHKRKAS